MTKEEKEHTMQIIEKGIEIRYWNTKENGMQKIEKVCV